MALKPITRQEQIVAGKELEPITRTERFLKDYGVSNYFGETTVMGDTLTWDGNTDGLMTVPFPGMDGAVLVRISEAVPTFDDCVNGIREVYSNGHSPAYTYDQLVNVLYPQSGVLCTEMANIIPYDNYELAGMVTIPKSGVWMAYLDGNPFVTSLTIPGYKGFETTTVKRMDEAYMPYLTSPGGKKFKLSVNDSGVLSATEV